MPALRVRRDRVDLHRRVRATDPRGPLPPLRPQRDVPRGRRRRGAMDPALIAAAVVAHYARAKRDLPWRRTRDPYAIWVSEIMLQQTRVATVIPYWERWLGRFPTVGALAEAPLDDVLAHWAGLGYYTRARNLHRGAREVVARWGGALPETAGGLREVPGIGAYTAGAIASIAYGERAPLVDGNVARVLARVFGIETDVKSTVGVKKIWALAGALMEGLADGTDPGDLNQGLMELGATVCAPRSPSCLACPLTAVCVARKQGRQDELPVVPARSEEHTSELQSPGTLSLPTRRSSDLGVKKIWALAGALMEGLADGTDPGDLNQGLMELGATVCAPRSPSCLACPLTAVCVARKQGRQDELPVVPA